MAHTFGKNSTRTSSTNNPISASFSVVEGETVLVLMLKINGATERTGGTPTYGGFDLTQADVNRVATEVCAELWYLLSPPIGTYNVSIPNAGGLTIFYTIATGKAVSGGRSALDGASGAVATSTNPAPGSITTTQNGDIGFAIAAGGHQDFTLGAATQTAIAETDDGANGGGEQYHLQATAAAVNLSWTHATSDDWAAIAVYFKEIPAVVLNNYQAVRSASDAVISVTEKIR